MDKEEMCCDKAFVERGKITAEKDGLYKVESYGRAGLVTPWIPAMAASMMPFDIGEKVYFFLFDDGHGAVIGRF